MTPLDVSVLICTRDRDAMLVECLASILACSPPPAEVIVVDQSRDERSRQAVCRLQGGPVPVRYLRGKGTGLSRAKNQGIADGTAGIVAFTDDDCRVAPDWLDALTAPLRHGEAAAAAGRTLPEARADGGEETFSFYRPDGAVRFSRWSHPWRVGGGGNFAVRREVLLQVGPYDERFGPGAPLESAEDMDMVHRLLRSGQRIVYAPAAVVWHRSWRSSSGNRRLSRAYGVGTGAYFPMYFLTGDLLSGWRFLQRGGVRSAHLLRALLRGDRRRFVEQAVYLGGLFEGLARYGSGLLPRRTTAPRLERRKA